MSFLGLAGYYKKFIKNFSTLAKLLTSFTKKNTSLNWTHPCEETFQKLKNVLCSAPVLRYPDYKQMFTLTTDARNVGLGTILSQEVQEVCYISRTLNKAELNYDTSEKELLAIIWTVKRLRQYLLGRKFIIQTNHQALTWLFNVKDPSSELMRWRLRMEGYYYYIVYKNGKENLAVDALCRIYPIQDKDLSGEPQENPENSQKIDNPEIDDTEKLTSDEDNKPISERLRNQAPKDKKEIHQEYTKWKRNRMSRKLKVKPTTNGKNRIEITK